MATLLKRPRNPDDFESDTDDSDTVYSQSSCGFDAPSTVSSNTSYTRSMRSSSPTGSVWSLTDSIREAAYKQEYGRELNSYSEVYRLPADAEERERLEHQHKMFMEIMGKYSAPLPSVLANDTPGETKAILDLGCGSGSWILDAANDFPHCNAVAVDLVPMQSPNMPLNCRSEVDDINLGLEHFYGDFNVVHARLISSGIKDFPNLINQIAHVLRPGGLIDLMEWDFGCYDEWYQPIRLDTSTIAGPWWPRWLAFLKLAARNRGGSVDAADTMYHSIKDHPLFDDVVYRTFYIPASPWDKSNAFNMHIGHQMQKDISSFLRAGRPLLLGSGMPENILAELEMNAYREVAEARGRHYIRVQCVYATKRDHRPQ